jgi:hypothetical protein
MGRGNTDPGSAKRLAKSKGEEAMNTAPRFRKESGRGFGLDLSAPLPSALSELPELRERVAQYARVVGRRRELEDHVAETTRHLDDVRRKDAEAIERALVAGKDAPKPRQGGSAEKRVEAAMDELRSFSATVPRSADLLLLSASEYVPVAAERATEEAGKALDALRDLLSAADRQLTQVARWESELVWLAALDGEPYVDPFTVRESQDIRRLRVALTQALAEFDEKRAKREAEAERFRAYEEANREQWAAREAHARKEADATRVVVEDGRIVEKGGKPVRRGAFGVEPIEDAEPET